MKYITLLVILLLSGCTTATPLCRHTVLSQYAAFIDAGYKAELWSMENKHPSYAGGYKYHVAVRVKVGQQWEWVEQPTTRYTTTTQQPNDTKLVRKMKFAEVAGWVIKREKRCK